ncbi:DUF3263 domain-containing protein [Rhodococcus sp. NPDC059968]|uniref:DUF3263 domain-containing protein n=1 Tax=Rhodococcus sp. NPDC059968 TaxID=3347017 RepID=UPI00367234E0
MNLEDKDIVDFARLWIPYGGPRSEDILVKFGMTPSRFYWKLARIVEASGPGFLSPSEKRFVDHRNKHSKLQLEHTELPRAAINGAQHHGD